MPLKSHRHSTHNKRHPKHYAKVYWPYIPLLLILGLSIFTGHSFVKRSQRDVLSYATQVSRSTLLEATNKQRESASTAHLTLNKKLNAAAQAKAKDMVARDYWSHTTPDNEAPWMFIDKAGYKYQKAGENLAYGFLTSDETVNGWMNSLAHRYNLLDSSYTEVGFGIANSSDFNGNGPETIVVAMYARPMNAPELEQASLNVLQENDARPVNSSRAITSEPSVKAVSKIQSMTSTSIPGISFIIGLLSGIAVAYLAIKHTLAIRRVIKTGEKFALQHPVLDVTIVSFIALCILLSQSVGVIR